MGAQAHLTHKEGKTVEKQKTKQTLKSCESSVSLKSAGAHTDMCVLHPGAYV